MSLTRNTGISVHSPNCKRTREDWLRISLSGYPFFVCNKTDLQLHQMTFSGDGGGCQLRLGEPQFHDIPHAASFRQDVQLYSGWSRHARHLRRVAQHRQSRAALVGRTATHVARAPEGLHQSFPASSPTDTRGLSGEPSNCLFEIIHMRENELRGLLAAHRATRSDRRYHGDVQLRSDGNRKGNEGDVRVHVPRSGERICVLIWRKHFICAPGSAYWKRLVNANSLTQSWITDMSTGMQNDADEKQEGPICAFFSNIICWCRSAVLVQREVFRRNCVNLKNGNLQHQSGILWKTRLFKCLVYIMCAFTAAAKFRHRMSGPWSSITYCIYS